MIRPGLVQDAGCQRGSAAGDGSGGVPHDGRGEVACVSDRGEHGHVVPVDGVAKCLLQRVQVGHVDVADVDAFLGQQRCELAQQLIGHAGHVWQPARGDSGVRCRLSGTRPIIPAWACPPRGELEVHRPSRAAGVSQARVSRPGIQLVGDGGQFVRAVHAQVAAVWGSTGGAAR